MSTIDIYKGVLPFVCVQVLALATVIAWPGLVTSMTGGGAPQAVPAVEIVIPPSESPETQGEEDRAAREIERALRGGK